MDQTTRPKPDKRIFRDDGRALLSLADRVLVRCRKCAASGIIVAAHEGARGGVTFRCGGCGTTASSADRIWLGPLVIGGGRHCQFCGHKWSVAPRRLAPGAKVPRHVSGPCPNCDRQTRSLAATAPVAGSEPTDPYLGLPLLLVTETRFGPLWCYNEQHLAFLRDYVAATQRHRSPQTHHHSMFVRLPAWMKLAKNRDEISKGLERVAAILGSIK